MKFVAGLNELTWLCWNIMTYQIHVCPDGSKVDQLMCVRQPWVPAWHKSLISVNICEFLSVQSKTTAYCILTMHLLLMLFELLWITEACLTQLTCSRYVPHMSWVLMMFELTYWREGFTAFITSVFFHFLFSTFCLWGSHRITIWSNQTKVTKKLL